MAGYLFQKIDASLTRKIGDACVSRFYSDMHNIVIVYGSNEDRDAVEKIMARFGYKLYDIGANGASLMATFKRQ